MLIVLSIFRREPCCFLILETPNWGGGGGGGLTAYLLSSQVSRETTYYNTHHGCTLKITKRNPSFLFHPNDETKINTQDNFDWFRCMRQAVNSGSNRGVYAGLLVQPLMWLPWLRAHLLTLFLLSHWSTHLDSSAMLSIINYCYFSMIRTQQWTVIDDALFIIVFKQNCSQSIYIYLFYSHFIYQSVPTNF